jgi:hypothetical protein
MMCLPFNQGGAGRVWPRLKVFWRRSCQSLLRKVEGRTAREPFGIALATLSYRDYVLGEDGAARKGIIFGGPRSFAVLHPPPGRVHRVL